MPSVLLCDEAGNVSGTCEKAEAHRFGKLHRAFSVFVFRRNRSELLIQRRVTEKLFGGLWANTCCSHPSTELGMPFPDHISHGELIRQAEQRLLEELGFTTPLSIGPTFVYRAEDPNGRGIENEFDTILIGDAMNPFSPKPDPQEVSEWKWIGMKELRKDIDEYPHCYVPWLPEALNALHGFLPE